MKNRYGDEYRFDKVSDNCYTIVGDLKYYRYGGREGQNKMDLTDLGFVDPSGGPFVKVGMMIEGRTIVRIGVEGNPDTPDRIIFEVEE
jgi:hypothetical protein